MICQALLGKKGQNNIKVQSLPAFFHLLMSFRLFCFFLFFTKENLDDEGYMCVASWECKKKKFCIRDAQIQSWYRVLFQYRLRKLD